MNADENYVRRDEEANDRFEPSSQHATKLYSIFHSNNIVHNPLSTTDGVTEINRYPSASSRSVRFRRHRVPKSPNRHREDPHPY